MSIPTGSFVDGFGHLVDGGVSTFYTQPARPSPQAFVTADTILDFEVAADSDGAVTVVAKTHTTGASTNVFTLGRFNPSSGAWQVLDTATDSASDKLSAFAFVTQLPDGTPTRLLGYSRKSSYSDATSAVFKDGVMLSPPAGVTAIIPDPAVLQRRVVG